MKLIAKIIIFSLCIANVHAELLIIKRLQPQAFNHSNRSSFTQYFAPLDDTDKPNYPAIAQVLLNYQWPMVIANPNLTPAEQDELLTADIPNAEENFIRRKLQKIDPAYDVAFIPTCLYELFVFKQAFNNTFFKSRYIIRPEERGLEHLNNLRDMLTDSPLDIAIKKFNKNISIVSSNIYQDYNRANNDFYPHVFFYINNLLAQSLFDQYPTLQISFNNFILSRTIQDTSHLFAAWLIHNFAGQSLYYFINFNQELSSKNRKTIDQNKILAQVIKLEYEARNLNKALLLRGSRKTELIREKKEHNVPILGSTILENKLFVAQDDNTTQSLSNNFLQSYKEKLTTPYSISFGNSLFAGYATDLTACAYFYLNRCNGYGLLINKKDQIQHQSNNLFFISPLSSISALFANGEMFHSRTKITSPQTNQNVYGLIRPNIYTKNALSIHRNPLRHAQLFSQYLADNMHIITNPIHQESFLEKYIFGIPDLSPEEQAIYDQKRMEESAQLRANQVKAADYYKAIQTLGNHLPVATANFQKRENKNVGQQMRNLRFNKDMQKIEDEHGKSSMETELS